jgi:diadenosine tetraphosphate (Ap4A) HIT family hydrolase
MRPTPKTRTGCPFCLENNFFQGEVIAESSRAYLARNTFSPDNYLVIPKLHIESPTDLPPTWWRDMETLFAHIPALKHDYNISLNNGRQAGQTVKHLCFWIIPRASGQKASGQGLVRLIDRINGKQTEI